MEDTPDRQIAQLAAKQYGVVSRCQLVAAGLGPRAITHRVRAGRLHRVHRGVYAVGHPRLSRDGVRMAATLAFAATALLCLHDAGAHWQLRASSASWVHVTIPSRAGRKPRPGIHIHRPLSLPDADRATHRGIPVTSVPRTLIDLAEVLPSAALARTIEQADALRLLDLVALREALARQPRRRGAALVASAVDGYRDDVITRSELEARLLVLCTQHRLPAPAVNVRVHGYEVDFLWPANRVIAETDGRRHHATHAAFERDRARDAQLTVVGYRVVRFTYRQVTRESAAVARTLQALLGTVDG
jgi:very-short-patch-repair endonuclease